MSLFSKSLLRWAALGLFLLGFSTAVRADEASVQIPSVQEEFVVSGSPEAVEGLPEVPTRVKHGVIYRNAHPGIYHYVAYSVGPNISLDDGSLWRVSNMHEFKWRSGQPIVISKGIFARYRLTNQVTGKYADFELCDVAGIYYRAPATPLTLYIANINYGTSQVILSDGSFWDVNDSYELNNWLVDDTIVLGVEDFFSSYKHLLINHRAQNHSTAQRR